MKSRLYFPIVLFSILLILFTVATFFDLSISKTICELSLGEYYSTNTFLVITEIFGETVLYALISAAAFALYFSKGKAIGNGKANDVATKIFAVILSVAINALCTKKIVGYLGEHLGFEEKLSGVLPVIGYLLSGIALSGIWYLIMSKITPQNAISASIWSLIVIFTALLSQIIVQGIKPVFGRIRFRAMNYIGDFSYYSPWYKVGALSEETKSLLKAVIGSDAYKSFPSGHTACASVIITLTALTEIFDKLKTKKWKVIMWSCALGYTAFIALSRIAIGAHFATDVLFAMIVTYASFYLCKFVIFKIFANKIEPKQDLDFS